MHMDMSTNVYASLLMKWLNEETHTWENVELEKNGT